MSFSCIFIILYDHKIVTAVTSKKYTEVTAERQCDKKAQVINNVYTPMDTEMGILLKNGQSDKSIFDPVSAMSKLNAFLLKAALGGN